MTGRGKRQALVAGLTVLSPALAGSRVWAEADAEATAPPDAQACSAPAAERPPDPRCGEALSGRSPGGPTPSLEVPRLLLRPPQLASRVLFWPIVEVAGFVEYHRIFSWMRAILTTDDRLIGVRPEIVYATGFLPTAGLRLYDQRLPLAGSEMIARFRTAGPDALYAEVLLSSPEWLGIGLRGAWSRRNDRLFAGIGAASTSELEAEGRGKARYQSDALLAEARWSRRLPAWLVVGLRADVRRSKYAADGVSGGPSIAELYGASPEVCAQLGLAPGCVNPSLVPGFEGGLRIVHAGAGLAFDRRSRARDGGGFSLGFEGTFGQGVAGDPSRLVALRGESVAAVGGIDRILFLRVQAALVEPVGGDIPIPFEELVSPSGAAGMRGFPDGRFRDRSGLVGTAEYRWFVAFNLDASLFVDAGTVAGPRFSGLGVRHLFPDFGIGLRGYAKPEGRYWMTPPGDSVQLAYAPDSGFRLLVSVAAF